jgi:hypothetical protein
LSTLSCIAPRSKIKVFFSVAPSFVASNGDYSVVDAFIFVLLLHRRQFQS